LSYKHFTLDERKYLQELLSEGLSFRKIADILGRNVSSVSREVARNRSKYPPKKKSNNKYRYHAWRAQTLCTVRRRRIVRRRLHEGTPEWNYIVEKLNLFWSPEQICNRWNKEHPDDKKLCTSTIYRYIQQGAFPGISRKNNLRRRGKKKIPRNSNFNTIQPQRIIPDWPESVKQRVRKGDWEGDTVYGGIGKGFLVTLVDRKTRYLIAGIVNTRSATETADVTAALLKGMPVETISFDNGSEFAEFKRLERELETEVYFAEPHKPWQRGTNENTNDILRFFFPKGYDFKNLSQQELDYVVFNINNRPRKCLNWASPFEMFWSD